MDAIVAARTGNAADFFVDRHVREGRGGKPAFIDDTASLTYGDLLAATQRFAAGLQAAGIARDTRIALILLDTVDLPICFWGAIRAGVVPIPINTLLPAELTNYILSDSRAELLVISESLLPALAPSLGALPHLRRVIVAGAAEAPYLARRFHG